LQLNEKNQPILQPNYQTIYEEIEAVLVVQFYLV